MKKRENKKEKIESSTIGKKGEEYALEEIKKKIKESPVFSNKMSSSEKNIQDSSNDLED